ncbi:MAG TPA: hypothetical protein VFA98_00925 [Thermoanaerobaculia bacterium]|nr:hypothetical protein [Thermoanaerobaculia bacterium]
MLHLAFVLLLASPAPAEPAYFRLDLSPSGSQVAIGEPVVKGGMVVFHAYPDGKLMSLRRTDVKTTTRISAKEAAGPSTTDPKPIANLAMQGGSSSIPSSSGRPAPTRPIVSANGAPSASGPQIVPVSDGVAVTTSNGKGSGPSIVPVADGVAVVAPNPK